MEQQITLIAKAENGKISIHTEIPRRVMRRRMSSLSA